jgi:hypothetical protein
MPRVDAISRLVCAQETSRRTRFSAAVRTLWSASVFTITFAGYRGAVIAATKMRDEIANHAANITNSRVTFTWCLAVSICPPA